MQNAGLDEAQAGIKIAGRNTNNLIRLGYILSPCLFNLYAEYIMQNAGLDESQTGNRTARRNINNLRYADD